MVTVLLLLKSMQMRPTSSNPLNEPTQKRPDAQDAPSPGLSGVPSAGGKVARRLEDLLGLDEGALDAGLPNEKYVTLPVVDSLSGNTEFCLDAAIKNSHESVTLERAVMTAFGWEEKSLIIVKANDESMEPSIQKGAKAIVDISQNDKIIVDKVYAISIFGDILLRRITRSKSDGKLILTPDCVTFYQNNKFKIEEYTDSVNIVGRVVMLRDAFI